MPKQKTHKGAAKRFKFTATGKIKRAKAYRNHMMGHKTRKQKRNLRLGGLVSASEVAVVKKMMPYA